MLTYHYHAIVMKSGTNVGTVDGILSRYAPIRYFDDYTRAKQDIINDMRHQNPDIKIVPQELIITSLTLIWKD